MKMPNTKPATNAEQKEPIYTEVTSCDVRKAKVINNKVTCDLVINGITIYGCWIRQTKDGRDFISWPQQKGRDGNYYSIVYIKLKPEHEEMILALIEKKLNE